MFREFLDLRLLRLNVPYFNRKKRILTTEGYEKVNVKSSIRLKESNARLWNVPGYNYYEDFDVVLNRRNWNDQFC